LAVACGLVVLLVELLVVLDVGAVVLVEVLVVVPVLGVEEETEVTM
jgi:hypothetical protein